MDNLPTEIADNVRFTLHFTILKLSCFSPTRKWSLFWKGRGRFQIVLGYQGTWFQKVCFFDVWSGCFYEIAQAHVTEGLFTAQCWQWKVFYMTVFRNLPVKSKYIITVIACLKLVPVCTTIATQKNNSLLPPLFSCTILSICIWIVYE